MSNNAKQVSEVGGEAQLSDDELEFVSGGTAFAPPAPLEEPQATREGGSGQACGKRQHGTVKL